MDTAFISIQLVMDTICIVNGFLNRILSVKILMFLSTPVYMRMVSGGNKRFVLLTYKTILGPCLFMFGNWFIVPYCMSIGLLSETFYGNRGIATILRNLMQPLQGERVEKIRLLLENIGSYEYHIVHLAILSDTLKVVSRNEKLCSYMLRGLRKSVVSVVFHSEGRKHIKQRVKTNIERGVSTDIVLWRIRIGDGKEGTAQERIASLQEHQEEGNKTLKNEREHSEIYSLSQENGVAYAYMFVLADDLGYTAKTAENSGNPSDAKYMEYMSVCVDLEDCIQLSPVSVSGNFSAFHSKKQ